VQVSGQVAVMAINGLLTKVMFDKNPTNEFFVEESFPLDWMYPHLTPFGIIMKINRQTLPSLTEEVFQKDHDFWSQYSQRLIGNWITYDTSVQEIANFVERVYVRHDYRGFDGDPRFVRDDQAQKAFSKLRSSIAGVYAWRIGPQCPVEFRPKTNEEYHRVLREAEFAFKQALAFCPYSPEAVFRYINVLFSQSRYEDALIIAQTCLKLDPNNAQVEGLVKQLQAQLPDFKQRQAAISSMQSNISSLEKKMREEPNNFSNAFALASSYLSFGQTNLAEGVLDGIVSNPTSSVDAILGTADYFIKLGNFAKLERALARLVVMQPENPEAWFDLAALYVNTGKSTEGLAALRKSVGFSNARLAADPKARNLLEAARADPRFTLVRQSPEFQKIMAGQ
jgi:thioredoxin-like negative regulator of GroEL